MEIRLCTLPTPGSSASVTPQKWLAITLVRRTKYSFQLRFWALDFLIIFFFIRVALERRMRKISRSRRRQFKWDSNSVSLPSEAIPTTTKLQKTT